MPALGLKHATAGEIVMACPPFLGGESTINRRIFSLAVDSEGEEAVSLWRDCLQTGDPMGHYGLGYTLYELGRLKEAYRHLRAYTELVPANPWAWCWLGRTCHALGDADEARGAYQRALELEREDEETATEAEELLELLDKGLPPSRVGDPVETVPEASDSEPLIVGFDGDGEVWVERSARIPDEASALAAIAWIQDGHQWVVAGTDWLTSRGDGWVEASEGAPSREFWRLTWKEGPVGG